MATNYSRLEDVPMFKETTIDASDILADANASKNGAVSSLPLNLISYDGVGRLFVWNSKQNLLHSVDVHHSSSLAASTSEPAYLAASQHMKTMNLSKEVNFRVRCLKFNRNGQALLLVGDGAMMMVEVVQQLSPFTTSSSDMYRAILIADETIFISKNGRSLRILDAAWHAYSDTHLGVLSSDGVFRLFDLSQDTAVPEQEYHLQLSLASKNSSKGFSRVVSFAFGGEHLWDKFTVFFLFTDGSIYALCPIVPFGSVFNGFGLEELKKDAGQLSSAIRISNAIAAGNASRSTAWLEAVFPDLCNESNAFAGEVGSCSVMKARAYLPLDASLGLQGPFPTVWSEALSSNKHVSLNISSPAAKLIYNNIGKDSILAVSLRDGQLLLHALADEIHPMWNIYSTPRIVVDDDGHLLSAAMLVETGDACNERKSMRDSEPNAERTPFGDISWTGQPPPLLQLARVDLALDNRVLETSPLSILTDPVVPERLYCYHAAGVDVIVMQWLPFSDQYTKGINPGVPPVVFPLLDIRAAGDASLLPLLGVTTILDILGTTWLVAVTPSGKAAVMEVNAHKVLPTHCFEVARELEQENKLNEPANAFSLISAELLRGPKDIHIPQVSSSGSPLTPDTVEGRTLLHDQCKLLREKYIEYAHRIYVELSSHGKRLDDVFQDMQRHLLQVQENLKHLQVTKSLFVARVQQAFDRNMQLHERVKKCSMLPGVRLKPLSAAEQSFQAQLDCMRLQDLEMLRSSVDVLAVRAERIMKMQDKHQKRSLSSSLPLQAARFSISDLQMRRLKLAVDQLTQIVDTTSSHTKLVEEVVKHREVMADRFHE